MGMRSKKAQKRTCKRHPSRSSRKYKKHKAPKSKRMNRNKRRAGSNWKSRKTQTVRAHVEKLRQELAECTEELKATLRDRVFLVEYVKNLEEELGVEEELRGVA